MSGISDKKASYNFFATSFATRKETIVNNLRIIHAVDLLFTLFILLINQSCYLACIHMQILPVCIYVCKHYCSLLAAALLIVDSSWDGESRFGADSAGGGVYRQITFAHLFIPIDCTVRYGMKFALKAKIIKK